MLFAGSASEKTFEVERDVGEADLGLGALAGTSRCRWYGQIDTLRTDRGSLGQFHNTTSHHPIMDRRVHASPPAITAKSGVIVGKDRITRS